MLAEGGIITAVPPQFTTVSRLRPLRVLTYPDAITRITRSTLLKICSGDSSEMYFSLSLSLAYTSRKLSVQSGQPTCSLPSH